MKPLFKDISLQEQFDLDGYVKIPLLDSREVEDLSLYYQNISIRNHKSEGFHVSLDNPDVNFVRETTGYIEKVLGPKILPALHNGKIFTASFTIKEKGNQYIVPPHQDWSFVDEDEFCSATVWVPLQDVDINNGALGVIRGSHKVFIHRRSSPSPQSQSPFTDHVSTLFSFSHIVDMKAGEALVFNNALIHSSPPNTSAFQRLAVGIGITQAEAKLLHYYQIPNTLPAQLQKYEVDKDFFIRYNNPKLSSMYNSGLFPQDYEKTHVVDRGVPKYTEEAIVNLVSAIEGSKRNTVLSDRLKNLLTPKSNNMTTEIPKESSKKTENEAAKVNGYVDNRTFFQKYTIKNIIAEIKWRLTKKS